MKRTLALLLSLLCLLTLLAGCQNSESTDPADTPATDTTDTTEPADTTEPDSTDDSDDTTTEETPAAEDETPVASTEVTLPIAAELTTYSIWTPNFIDSAMPYSDPNEFPIWQEMESRTNIHIEWVLATLANAQEQFGLMVTSQDYEDVFIGVESYLTGGLDYSIDEEIIIDLSELVPQYMPNYYELMSTDEYTRKMLYTDEGNMGKLQVLQESPEPPFAGWVVRQDLLDQIGYEGAMVTIDDWTTVLSGLSEAGLGKLYLGSSTGQQEFLMSAYGVTTDFLQKDGEVFYGPVQQGYYDYLEQIVAWNEAGYIDPDFVSHVAFYSDFALMISGEIAIMPTIYSLYDTITMMGVSTNPDFALTPVDVPKLNEGDKLLVDNFGGPSKAYAGGSSACISAQCEDPVTLLKWFEYFFTDEGKLLSNYGLEDVSYTMVDGVPTYTDLVLANADGLTKGQAQSLYTISSYVPHCYDYARAWADVSEGAMACMDIWDADYDFENYYDMPPVSLSIDESETIGSRVNDISTYVSEYTAQVVTGQQDLASTWEDYVAAIEAMDLQTCIDVYQSALDRFLAR